MKFLRTKPKVKSMNIDYHNLYYTVNKNRDDKESVNDNNENTEIDYINFKDLITPYHYIGIINDNEILKQRSLRSYINHFK